MRIGRSLGLGIELSAELVIGRTRPYVACRPAKREAAGSITMRAVGCRKGPSAAVRKIVFELAPTRTTTTWGWDKGSKEAWVLGSCSPPKSLGLATVA
jgi:hypothetical protein